MYNHQFKWNTKARNIFYNYRSAKYDTTLTRPLDRALYIADACCVPAATVWRPCRVYFGIRHCLLATRQIFYQTFQVLPRPDVLSQTLCYDIPHKHVILSTNDILSPSIAKHVRRIHNRSSATELEFAKFCCRSNVRTTKPRHQLMLSLLSFVNIYQVDFNKIYYTIPQNTTFIDWHIQLKRKYAHEIFS